MSPKVATLIPCRASQTPSSTSGASVTQTGHPGPMITSSAFGKFARRPYFAIACSWLPQTCMIVIGARPISPTSETRVRPSSAASSGSRNFTSRASPRRSDIAVSPRGLELAPHVGAHQVVLGGSEQLLVQRQRVADRLVGDAADGESGMVEDVVADLHGHVDDVEPDLTLDSPEIDRGGHVVDFEDATGNSKAHGRPPWRMRALATTAWPNAMPPSPGGTVRASATSNSGVRSRRNDSVSSAFWKQPPPRTTGRRPVSRVRSRSVAAAAAESVA